MKQTFLADKVTFWSNFIVFRRNFFFLLLIAATAWYWFTHFSSLAGDSAGMRILLSIITLVFSAAIAGFSLLTVLPAYLAFWIRRSLAAETESAGNLITIRFPAADIPAGLVPLSVEATGVRRPLAGAVKAALLFEGAPQSEALLLSDTFRSPAGRKGRRAEKNIMLPNSREYRLRGSILHFEDFFRLFALPYFETGSEVVYTEPQKRDGGGIEVNTEKSDEAILKVQQHKKARGELFDYKKYTPGDDIRRILWKNYARTRELSVRIPDRNLPYVSHINLMVSFYDATPAGRDLRLKTFLIDVYKEKLRQVIDSIIEQGFTVQLFIDQGSKGKPTRQDYRQFLKSISAAGWQQELAPGDFVRGLYHQVRGAANILVFSSLCPAEAIDDTHVSHAGLNLCYYNVETTLAQTRKPPFLQQLFMVDIHEPLEAARRELAARSTTRYLRANSAEIEKRLTGNQAVMI